MPSLLRNFSAPVKMTVEGQTDEQLLFLFANDTDPFNRWVQGRGGGCVRVEGDGWMSCMERLCWWGGGGGRKACHMETCQGHITLQLGVVMGRGAAALPPLSASGAVHKCVPEAWLTWMCQGTVFTDLRGWIINVMLLPCWRAGGSPGSAWP